MLGAAVAGGWGGRGRSLPAPPPGCSRCDLQAGAVHACKVAHLLHNLGALGALAGSGGAGNHHAQRLASGRHHLQAAGGSGRP